MTCSPRRTGSRSIGSHRLTEIAGKSSDGFRGGTSSWLTERPGAFRRYAPAGCLSPTGHRASEDPVVLVSNNEHTKAERRWRRVGQRARRGTRAIRNAALRPSRGSRRAVPIGFETLLFTDPALNLRTSVEDPTTESNRLRSNVAVPPVVQSRLGKSILLTDILERQQLGWGLWVFTAGAGFVGHVLTVSHTSDYCHGVPSKKEGPVVVGRWNYLPPELRHPGPQVFFAEVTHAKYPGMRVRVEYDGDLNLEAITVMSSSDGPQLGARLLRDFPYGAIDAAARSRMANGGGNTTNSGRNLRHQYPGSPLTPSICVALAAAAGRIENMRKSPMSMSS